MRKDAPTGPWLLRSWVAEPQRQPCSRVGLPPRGTWVIDEEKEASVDDMFAFGGFAEEASLSGGAAGVGEGRCEVWLRTSKSRQKRKKRVAPKRDMRRPAPDMELWRREGEKNRTDTCPRRRFSRSGVVRCLLGALVDRSIELCSNGGHFNVYTSAAAVMHRDRRDALYRSPWLSNQIGPASTCVE